MTIFCILFVCRAVGSCLNLLYSGTAGVPVGIAVIRPPTQPTAQHPTARGTFQSPLEPVGHVFEFFFCILFSLVGQTRVFDLPIDPCTAQPTHFKGSERPGAELGLGVEGYFGVRRGKYQMITETKPTSLSNP